MYLILPSLFVPFRKLQYCCRAMADFQPVLDFWFPPGKSTEERQKVWFAGTSADNGIRDKFGDLVSKFYEGYLVSHQ